MMNSKKLLIALTLLFLYGCSATPMDDFFGIEMPPESASRFKIVSFDENGVSYTSDFTMNNKIYAYAELKMNEILIKVVNNSNDTLFSNYNTDFFYLKLKNGNVYGLLKGERDKFPQKEHIYPGEEIQFRLILPNDLREYMDSGMPLKRIYAYQMWEGADVLSFYKNEITELKVILGGKANIILKPIPKAKSE